MGIVCEYKLAGDESAPSSSRSDLSDLAWPPVIENSVQKWKATGAPPFPHLPLAPSPSWHQFDLNELRYLYYHLAMASILELSGMSGYCHWWEEFSTLVLL